MAYVMTYGGSSGAGKGEISSSSLEVLKERFGEPRVQLFDQGATYRFAVVQALGNGYNSPSDIVKYVMGEIVEAHRPADFHRAFDTFWQDEAQRKKLRTQEVSGFVALVGEQDRAQHFFTDILNLRLQAEIARGIEAAIVDSRTPEVLISPTLEEGYAELICSSYMYTSSETAALWASRKPDATKSYEELLRDFRARNKRDATRKVLPNMEPERNSRTEINPQNIDDAVTDIAEGRVVLAESRLYIVNDGGLPKERLHKLGSELAIAALSQSA